MPRRKASDASENADLTAPRPAPTARATRTPRTQVSTTTAPATPGRRPGRRRAITADSAQETATIVDAVLKSRGTVGATSDLLQSVIAWAREIREEGDVLIELTSRPRRRKTAAAPERIARYEMDRALLDGVLAGTVLLDVREGGQLLFKHALNREITSAQSQTAEAPILEMADAP